MSRRLASHVLLPAALALACVTVDQREETTRYADELARFERSELWTAPTDGRSADLIVFLPGHRVLVGAVEGGAAFGEAEYGAVQLLDVRSGGVLWRAEREARIDAAHALLAHEPVLLFLTSHPDGGELWALDPASGERRWTHALGRSSRAALASGGRTVVALSAAGSGAVVETLDVASGRTGWKKQLDQPDFELAVHGSTVLVHGSRVRAFDLAEGDLASTLTLGEGFHRVLASGAGTVVWTHGAVTLVEPSGEQRWSRTTAGLHQALVAAQEQLVRLVRDRDVLGTDTLEALDPSTGDVLWSADAGGLVVSPLAMHGGQVLFTVEDAVVGLDASTGAAAFRTPLPLDYALANPVSVPLAGVPDVVALHDDVLVVDREGAGLRAFALPDGSEAWNVPARRDEMTVAKRYGEVLMGDELVRQSGGVSAAGVPLVDWSGARRNVIAEQAQDRHDRVMRSTARVLDDSTSTGAERQDALSTRRLETESEVTRLEGQAAQERSLAGAELGLAAAQAIGSIADELRRSHDLSAMTALTARARVNWMWSLRSRDAAFQGAWHATGFSDKRSSGVQLVDLTDGRVEELRYEPRDPLQETTRVATDVFGLSPDGDRLVLIGLGLDTSDYEADADGGGLFRVEGIKASILCYDPRQARPEVEGADGPDPFAGMSFDDMQMACLVGHVPSIERLLAGGADANEVFVLSAPDQVPQVATTPLRLAAQKCSPRMTEVLLAAGARPTRFDVAGPTAMDVAAEEDDGFYADQPNYRARRAEVRALLEAAGAERRPALAAPASPSAVPEPPDDVAVGAHLFLLRRELAKNAHWRDEPLVAEALEAARPDVARALLERGADPNAGSAQGRTALHVAAAKNDVAWVRRLLERGADVDAGRGGGLSTPLAWTLNPFKPPSPALHRTVEILLEAGADPDPPLSELTRSLGTYGSVLECAEKIGGGLAELLRARSRAAGRSRP